MGKRIEAIGDTMAFATGIIAVSIITFEGARRIEQSIQDKIQFKSRRKEEFERMNDAGDSGFEPIREGREIVLMPSPHVDTPPSNLSRTH